MTQPLVTTIIPSYNHARYVKQAMQSVLDQDYPNIELLVVDDGSNDDSHAVIRDFVDRHPQVRAILNEQNCGQSAVLNQALAATTGKFVQLLPSDDWYLPEKTRLQVAKFLVSSPNVGVVYGRGYRYFEDSGKTIDWTPGPLRRGDVLRALIEHGNFVYPVTPMFRRECFEREPLDESYRAEGEAIYPRFARHFHFDFVEEHVGVMRDHSYNIGKDAVLMYGELNRYFDRVFSDPGLTPELKALEPAVRARHHRTKGMQLIRSTGSPKLGRESLLRALALRPRLLFDPKVITALGLSLLPCSKGPTTQNSKTFSS